MYLVNGERLDTETERGDQDTDEEYLDRIGLELTTPEKGTGD
jgi:hypothetical protein